ncbi:MAG: isochorismatase family protein [Rhodobacteraceae bacterium]|nr:isochorismatase family protein [Paracoccaceae bacterium]
MALPARPVATATPFHELLRLDPARCLLVPIDMQEEHRADPRYLVAGYDRVLGNAARLLAAARAAGVPCLHAGYLRDFTRVPPRPFEPVEADGTPAFSAPGSALTAFCPEVAPLEDEAVVLKNDLSCFSEPAFRAHVAALAPEWLVICGVWSEACVSATVRDAVAAGYRVLLVRDACGSGSAAMHEVAVITLANRLYGGAVCDTARACALLAGEEALAWRLSGAAPLRFDPAGITPLYDSF